MCSVLRSYTSERSTVMTAAVAEKSEKKTEATDKTNPPWGDGIEHLGGTLYRVPFKLIEIADVEPSSKDVQFFNPRNMIAIITTQKPAGCDAESMASLRDKIRTQGLHNPLTCRWIVKGGKWVPQIVNGERRFRSISKLRSEKNAKAYNSMTKEYEPAAKLYEFVECRIWEMDDAEAFRVANAGNAEAVDMGEACDAAQVRYFRDRKLSDAQIMEFTGKSESWLREMDMINKLDEKSFAALASDKINRAAALTLSKIENVEERLTRLDGAIANAEARANKMKVKIGEDIQKAEAQAAEAEAQIAAANKTGDVKKKEEGEKKKQQAATRIEKKKQQAQSLKGKAGTGDLKKAADEKRPLSHNKLQKFWVKDIAKAVKNKCKTETGEEMGFSLMDAKLAQSLVDNLFRGEEQIYRILKAHTRMKERAGST